MQEYLDLLLSKLEALPPYHLISHTQCADLKQLIKTMNKDAALMSMNFVENHSFDVQDEAHGYHWTHQICNVHPVVCYYKSSADEQEHASLCFLSKELHYYHGLPNPEDDSGVFAI